MNPPPCSPGPLLHLGQEHGTVGRSTASPRKALETGTSIRRLCAVFSVVPNAVPRPFCPEYPLAACSCEVQACSGLSYTDWNTLSHLLSCVFHLENSFKLFTPRQGQG